MNQTSSPIVRLLLAGALAVFVAGVALAVARPGDLDDGDDTGDRAAPTVTEPGGTATTGTDTTGDTTADTTSDSTSDSTAGTTGSTADTTGSAAGQGGGSATSSTLAGGGATSTTAGSGLGGSGASTADPTTASTGAESLVVPGLALLGGALAARQAARRRTVA